MICASVYLLVFIRNLLVHLAEKILLLQPLKFGGITVLIESPEVASGGKQTVDLKLDLVKLPFGSQDNWV